MKAPKPENTYELCPAGTHVARLYKIINLGTHDTEWQGQAKTSVIVRLYWELPNEIKEYEKEVNGTKEMVKAPFAISREMTFSMGEKANLRKIVEGMIGSALSDDEAYDFDLESLLGHACILTVIHETGKASGNKFALVSSTSPLMRGMEAPAQVNESEVIDVDDLNEKQISELPQWLGDKMRESHEYRKKVGQPVSSDSAIPEGYEDIKPEDIPF